ncbi:acyl-CoA dehydrogenase family protein [Rhizorhapis suberifaciens]|uniref:Alkylation response protein AidB-like acyl-CoA dehydrogenase n=1 Tax=Rhizorhapis suberifaciens TaxID=13656 RepID=A0A840HXY6_9SPHN|nr:acyl-CoA dehydrogenase family protein [Rhizorhapis suberifaciens]MBB4642975.1 alkylation response protein AidB-like acyl-CoA dehydrogenase [Rhizorhapis suberifaciens]
MIFALTDTQQMFGDMLGKLLDAENDFEERRRRLSGASPDRMALWPALAEQGILGATFPEEAGGFGGTMRDIAVVMEEVGRKLVVEPVLANALCGGILRAAGEDLSALIAGETVIALAHEEGYDPFGLPETRAARAGEGYHINGRKLVVRHADLAERFIVTATLDGVAGAYLVDARADGITRDSFRLIDGSSAATMEFLNVPARWLAGNDVLVAALEQGLVALAAETVGIVTALNAATFAYLGTRQQFGVPLASFQALQHRAADMFAAAEEARALTEQAIEAMDAATPDRSALASAVKALADDAGRRIGHEAVQMHGGMGVSDELDVSHYMRRLAAIRAELGSADLHRARFAGLGVNVVKDTPFRAEVRAFVRAHLPEDIARKGALGMEIDKDDYVRWQKILYEKGWFAGAWPVEQGGAGWSMEQQLVFLQESSVNNAPMIIPYGVNMIGPVLQEFGTDEQRAKYLPGILSSDTWWCQGYSEPNSGSDLASLKTTAVRDGDHYIVNGTKMWTTEAHWADMMHCLVRTDREVKAQRGISMLLIDMTSPGIEVRPIVTIDGQHHTNQLFLDNVRVPAENLVGEEGQGWTIAKFLLSHERVAIADTGPKLRLLKNIKAMLAEVPSSSAKARLSEKLAGAEIELLTLCALEQSYVTKWAGGASKDGPEASVLKVRSTEILQKLSEIALEIEGPLGGAHDPEDLHLKPHGQFTPSQRASFMGHQYLYGRCWSIFGGTNEIQRNLIARSLVSG